MAMCFNSAIIATILLPCSPVRKCMDKINSMLLLYISCSCFMCLSNLLKMHCFLSYQYVFKQGQLKSKPALPQVDEGLTQDTPHHPLAQHFLGVVLDL